MTLDRIKIIATTITVVLCIAVFVVVSREVARTREVLLINGTNEAYDIVLRDGARITLVPGVFERRQLGLGNHALLLARASGEVIDVVADNSGVFFTALFKTSQTEIVNPDACAVLVVDEREYTISRAQPDKRTLQYGKTARALDVDFVDDALPRQLDPAGGRMTKRRLTAVPLAEGLELIERIDGPETHALIAKRCARWSTPSAPSTSP